MSGLVDVFKGGVSNLEQYVESQWSQRMVQVAVYSGIVFYVLSSYDLISFVEKQLVSLGLKVGREGTRAVHAIIFAVFMYFGSRFILDPLVARLQLNGRKANSK